MDLAGYQKSRRKRGAFVLVLAMFFLANAVRMTANHDVPAPIFLIIYSSGMILGAGIAIIVASYRVMREIAKAE